MIIETFVIIRIIIYSKKNYRIYEDDNDLKSEIKINKLARA